MANACLARLQRIDQHYSIKHETLIGFVQTNCVATNAANFLTKVLHSKRRSLVPLYFSGKLNILEKLIKKNNLTFGLGEPAVRANSNEKQNQRCRNHL